MDYKAAGVDREGADEWIDSLKARIARIRRKEVLSEIGDFGGFFEAPRNLKDPVFVATTDGVGTKLLLAEQIGKGAHKKVGQDCVAMCVNDLAACTAEPLIFLDYLAVGKLETSVMNEVLDGIISACEESGCSLAGGETAEMPGYYPGGRYDVAGFSIGVLERSARLRPENIQSGDLVFGWKSAGFHSNGFSLVRKVLQKQNWKLDENFEGKALSDWLLEPTRLYVRPLLDLIRKSGVSIKAAAHITGGGLVENLPRGVIESKVKFVLKRANIETPAFMRRFVEAAELDEVEAYSTWNMGIGFTVVVPAKDREACKQAGLIELGHIESKSQAIDSSVIFE